MCATPENNPYDSRPIDTLIIGQGIAGSLLGWELHRRGQRIQIVDECHKGSASLVAAGMINPVQGQRLNTIWEIEKCLPAAMETYRGLEAHFHRQFFFPRKIIRLIKDAEQADILQTRLADPAFVPYLSAIHPPEDAAATATGDTTENANALHAPCGSVQITGGGYLDTQALLHLLRDFFRSEGLLVEERFAHADLDLSQPDTVRWQGIRARRIIFAEGWRILDNPFFAAYTFVPTKGQILTVEATAPLPDFVINRGKWLVPMGGRTSWIGATFERGVADTEPTAEASAEILADVQAILPANPLQERSARAGIRLATQDHIPRLGFLPDEPRIGLFSAFGSKGNCLAPYLARCMADHILEDAALPPRADIATKKTTRALHNR